MRMLCLSAITTLEPCSTSSIKVVLWWQMLFVTWHYPPGDHCLFLCAAWVDEVTQAHPGVGAAALARMLPDKKTRVQLEVLVTHFCKGAKLKMRCDLHTSCCMSTCCCSVQSSGTVLTISFT